MIPTGGIELRCERGHTQQIQLDGFTRAYALQLAGLLDGTSALYLHPPDERSDIGKCEHKKCRAKIRATVYGFII